MTVEDRHIRVSEAAALFGVPRTTLYRWIEDAEVQIIDRQQSRGRTGRVKVYRLSELAAVVAERHAEQSADCANEDSRGQSDLRSHAQTQAG